MPIGLSTLGRLAPLRIRPGAAFSSRCFRAGLLPLAVGVAGCSNDCNRDGAATATRYEDGLNPSPGAYETSPAAGPYLNFSSGQRWELVHGLATVPVPDAFVSFQRCPTLATCDAADDETGGFARAAGNVVVFEELNEDVVVVRNDTCADLFLRVVLSAP